MTLQTPERAPASPTLPPSAATSVTWLSPADGLWAGTRSGEHAGMIVRVDGVFHATDGRGADLGSFPDLDRAQAAFGIALLR